MRKLEEVLLVEQPELKLATFHQRSNLAGLECRDPGDVLALPELVDRLLGNHPAVPDQDQGLDAEVLLELVDLRHEGLGIVGVAVIDRHPHRAAAPIGEQPVVNLQLALFAVAIVPELGQRAGDSLEVARAQVVEHQTPLAEMTRGELLFDCPLALQQPVHRRVEVVLVGIGNVELFGQRRGVPPAGGGELGVWGDDTSGHHRAHQITLPTPTRR